MESSIAILKAFQEALIRLSHPYQRFSFDVVDSFSGAPCIDGVFMRVLISRHQF
jgi:hypothetical protein